jgi:hypothetical protein
MGLHTQWIWTLYGDVIEGGTIDGAYRMESPKICEQALAALGRWDTAWRYNATHPAPHLFAGCDGLLLFGT